VQYALEGRLSRGLPPLPFWYRLPAAWHLPGAALAYACAALLILPSLALLVDRGSRAASLVLGLFLLAASLLHLTRLHAVLYHGSARTAFLEPLALAAAVLVLHGLIAPAAATVTVLPGRVLFALCMIVFGIQHFLYPGIAAAIPRWIHFHQFWVMFTGVALLAAGLAILARTSDRYAGMGLAAMFFGWLVLLHIPLIAAHPRNAALWSSGLVALGLCGGSLVVAASAGSAHGASARSSPSRPRKR
jgi:uncharacterized membrane protein